jgi:hypothetical protein
MPVRLIAIVNAVISDTRMRTVFTVELFNLKDVLEA